MAKRRLNKEELLEFGNEKIQKLPKNKFVAKVLDVVHYISGLKINVYSANACYFIILALFPMLVLILSILRYTGLEVATLTDILSNVVPGALMPYAEKLILNTYENTSGTIISVSAVTALWSASRGIYGVLTGLNTVYSVSESRNYFYTRTISMVYTFLFLVVLLLTLVLHIFGTIIMEHMPAKATPLISFLTDVLNVRYIILLVVQTIFFTAIYMVLPNRRNRLMDSLPGALFTSLGWMIFSNVYSLYVQYFPRYANIYGSVYAIALAMLWLYCCISIVLFGGALNQYLVEYKRKRSEQQPPAEPEC